MKKLQLLKEYYTAERAIGIVFVVIGAVGLYDTVYGTWRAGPGYGATFFPRLAFILLIAIGLFFQFVFRDNKTSLIDWNDIKTLILLIGTGAVYFQSVRRIGLIVSTLFYCTLLIALLTNKPVKNLKMVIIPGLIGTVIVWLLFTQLVSMVLPRSILF